jgi:hypothetical protein
MTNANDNTLCTLRAFLAERDVACPGCGYNLRGIAGSGCPECGWLITLSELRAAAAAFGSGLVVMRVVPVVALLFVVPGVLGCFVLWRWLDAGWPGKFISPIRYWVSAGMGGAYLACALVIAVRAVQAWRAGDVRCSALLGRWLFWNVMLGIATAVVALTA